jgi:outer membrane autotransporter protein
MDRIKLSGDNPALSSELVSIVDRITADMSPEQADTAFRQLVGESLANVTSGVASTALRTQGVVLNRLDRIREIEIDNLTPPAAGTHAPAAGYADEDLNRIWAGGFGIWSEGDNRDDIYGYEFAAGGVAIGYDRKIAAVPGLRIGFSAAFSSGTMDHNDSLTSIDLDTYGLGVYGSYILPNRIVFLDANVAYAHTEADYTTNLVGGGSKNGSFDIDSWQFGLRGGAILRAGKFQFIPSVGVRFVSLSQGAFIDSLSDSATYSVPLRYSKRTEHQVDIPVQVKINTTVEAGPATFTPELRLGYTFAAKKGENFTEVGFVGSNQTYRMVGARNRNGSGQFGLGLKVDTGGVVDCFVNYDLDFAEGYHSHNASLGIGFEF